MSQSCEVIQIFWFLTSWFRHLTSTCCNKAPQCRWFPGVFKTLSFVVTSDYLDESPLRTLVSSSLYLTLLGEED